MKLIVGLGNPGMLYRNTRHNVGMRVINQLAKKHKIKLVRDRHTFSRQGKAKIEGIESIIAQPLVFMNLSGKTVAGLLTRFNISLADLLVIYDDLDLMVGKIRIRAEGGSAGHKGLKSIIDNLATKTFPRLRIGIGKTVPKHRIRDYVLSAFNREEELVIRKSLKQAVSCCETWIRQGIREAMNQFN